MAKKKVFLTGGWGFVLSNFAEQSGEKYELFRPTKEQLDLTDASAVEKYVKEHDFDVVIHGANVGGTRNTAHLKDTVEENLKCFFNVARCNKHFGKMIQLGSGAEYDKSRPIVGVKESEFDQRVPHDNYGFYKYVCSKYLPSQENITCLRLFGCYGKYEDYSIRFISNAICRSLYGLPIVVANQNVRFSYIFIEDFARVLQHFVDHDAKHRFYNAVPDEVCDLVSIGGTINKAAGRKGAVVVKKPGMGNEYSADNSLLKEEIPSFKFTPLEHGIGKLYRWYAQKKEKGELDLSKIKLEGE